jgi:hypothetical protein
MTIPHPQHPMKTETQQTTAQHTAGPWDYIVGRTLIHVETQIDNPSGAGIPICSLPKTSEANARLIAASPELLEACRAALQVSPLLPMPQSLKLQRKLHAAIARAESA